MTDELSTENLSLGQREALDKAEDWWSRSDGGSGGPQVFRMFGCAGTGKTSLVRTIVDELGLRPQEVRYAAFTGKAARVLTTKDCPAQTIHSLIYVPVEKARARLRELEAAYEAEKDPVAKDNLRIDLEQERDNVGTPGWTLNTESELRHARLLVIDEVSMVNERMALDLLSFGVPTIVLGDPAQLPPVAGTGWFMLEEPDVMLTEIHRSEAGSAVTKVATIVRQSNGLGDMGLDGMVAGDDGLKSGLFPRKLTVGEIARADVVLCWTNRTRWELIHRLREARGFAGGLPEPGERIIVLSNDNDLGVINGQEFMIEEVDEPPRRMPKPVPGPRASGRRPQFTFAPAGQDPNIRWMTVTDTWSGLKRRLPVHIGGFGGPDAQKDTERESREYRGKAAIATFAHAITTHKCVAPDTLVGTAYGLQRIADIPDEGLIATPRGVREYYGKFTRPASPVRTMTTENGYRLTATTDHGITVFDPAQGHVRKEFASLVEGDWVRLALGDTSLLHRVTLPRLPEPPHEMDVRARRHTFPGVMTVDVAEFLGLMVADGTVFNGGFRLAKRHRDVVYRFTELCEKIFDARVRQITIGRTPAAEVSSVEIVHWLRTIGGMGPNDKSVPDVVLASPSHIQAAFMRGLAEDGTVNIKQGVVDHVEITNRSADFLRIVQVMLLHQQVVSKVVEGPEVSHLYIYGRDNLTAFSRRVGFIAQAKNDRLNEAFLPWTTRSSLAPVTEAEAMELSDLVTGSDRYSIRYSGRHAGHITKDMARRVVRQGEKAPSWLAERLSWHYERVSVLEDGQSGETMCVTVPHGHRFLQNGFDGWNSQGSQWDKVAVVAEWHGLRMMSGAEQAKQHAYTSVTRAAKTVVITKGVA